MEAEFKESLRKREIVKDSVKLKIEKIKEKIKPKRWAYLKDRKNELHQIVAKFPEPDYSENVKIFQRSLNFFVLFSKPIGFSLSYEWKWRNHPRFWFTILFLIFTWFHLFYSQYLSINSGASKEVLGIFAIYGIASSIVLKTMCITRYFKEMTALSNFILKLFRENITGRRAEDLKTRSQENFTFYKWCSFLGATVVVLFVAYPIKAFIIDRELQSLVPMEILFLDQSTQSGFVTANIIMAAMGIHAYFISVCFGSTFLSAICNYRMQVDLIKEDIQDLDEMWSGKSITTVAQRHMFLRNICRKYQDMNEYITEVKTIFDTKIFLYFSVSYVSQIICLYEIAANNWIPGYCIALALFMEMMMIFNFIVFLSSSRHKNERLCSVLQQSIWYTHDLHSQKMFLLLTYSCMNTKSLWIGPLAPLSVLTGTQIVKSVYSYYTILMEVI